MIKRVNICLGLLLTLSLAGCSDQGDPVQTTAQISYTVQIQPIFNQNCSCHLSATPPNNMHLTSYSALMAVPPDPLAPVDAPVIIPGQPDSSHLYKRITGVIQPQMPYLAPPLSSNLINLIGNWISQGALNN